jgi:hypothetical protein
MAYGTAFHKFLQDYYNGVEPELAVQKAVDYYTPHSLNLPEDAWHTGAHLVKAITTYQQTYPRGGDGVEVSLSTDGKPLTEQKFSIPFWNNDTHEIILSGTIDLIGSYYGTMCLLDHKTTSSAPAFARSFFESYDIDIQTMFYSWVTKNYLGFNHYPPVIINGIFLKRATQKAAKMDLFDGVHLERSGLIAYNDDQMAVFETWVLAKLDGLKAMLTGVARPTPEFAACKQSFGLCEFWKLCRADRSLTNDLIDMNYTKTKYDPALFQD